ncbi:hypothetical protein KAOT1_00455 [Kordia algicida OT-1]|uniref:Uncharacterized protein n=1 Tax=Kordia algicida OT-1 TaxID=391587 RepID=A9E9S9_9FLAO|nr:hypothetical protein KAOT1_00455 [Kordia algicida OT-1]
MDNIYVLILIIINLVFIGILLFFMFKMHKIINNVHSILSIESLKFDKLDFAETKDRIKEMHSVILMMKFAKFLENMVDNEDEK